MPLPQSVSAVLRELQIDYHLLERDDRPLDPASIAKVLFLHCGERELQVFIPGDCLLDLGALNEYCKEDCHAFAAEITREIFERHGIMTVPAIPQLTGFRTLVDENLLRLPVVHLQSGTAGKLVRLNQGEFKRLIQGADNVLVTVPLEQLPKEGRNSAEDLEQIHAALHSHTLMKVHQRLDQTLEIPPLPASAQRILDLRSQEEPDMDELVGVVESDAPLAARVIGYASSPFFGVGNNLKSVQEAIVRVLGFERVMNVALGLALGRSLNLPIYAPQDELPFWEQSVVCAALIDRLARVLPLHTRPETGLAYLAGLLHNFGNLVLGHVFGDHLALTCRYIEASPHISHSAIERHLISVSREQLGATLLRSWKIPDCVCVAIRQQENPEYAETHYNYANLLFISTRLISQWKTGDVESHAIPAMVYERLGLNPDDANNVAQEMLADISELQALAQQLAA